jgi:SAM-dependent methyltransferase
VLKEKDFQRHLDLATQIETLWGQNTCEVIKCSNCDFCYSNPYIAGDEKFYTIAYERNGYPKWKWEFEETFLVLKQYKNNSNISLLEIGAGDGAFINKILQNIFSKENLFCTEFSQFGRKKIENMGVKCFDSDFRNFTSQDLHEKYDFICMFQVLEHLDNLQSTFLKLNWLMKIGGSLFISVPDNLRIEFNELNCALLDMPPNHVGRWNKKCFEIIGIQYGFKIENYKNEKFSFFSMAKQYINYRMLRKSQFNGTLENWIFSLNHNFLFKLFRIISFSLNTLFSLPKLLMMDSSHGGSQWVHLIKIDSK